VVNFRFRRDGSQVGYIANQENAGDYELYETAFATPGVVTKLSSNPVQGAGLYSFAYTADGNDVVYLSGHDSAFAELYRVKLATPAVSQKLNSTLVTSGEVWEFQLTQ
jgi:hypothetical protein